MADDVVMPRLSDSMEEGTILQWLKGVGEEVAVGEELVEIETDKANMAYESDTAGVLVEIVAAVGETLPIGSVIARVGAAEEGEKRAKESSPKAAATPNQAPPESRNVSEERIKASPLARRIATELGVDLGQLQGSGPGGRIVKSDVERAGPGASTAARRGLSTATPEAAETAKGQTTYEELNKLQRTVARRMAESKATAPHFYLSTEIDMEPAVRARGRLKAAATQDDVLPSVNDMVIKACALALREHPRANGAYRDGQLELYSRVNVGVAVAAQDSLVVPTIFDADRKGLRQIASESRSLAERVRSAQVTPPELSGATFTVSNLGMFGIDSFAAVINPPQAAILAVGAIKDRAVVRDGEIRPGHLMQVTLACDHRILYGATGAAFLARIRGFLEEPLSLAL